MARNEAVGANTTLLVAVALAIQPASQTPKEIRAEKINQRPDEFVAKRNHSQLMWELLSRSMSSRFRNVVADKILFVLQGINSALGREQLPIDLISEL